MPRVKKTELLGWQKVLSLMISGEPISIEEFESKLGSEIYMYRMSAYIWKMKNFGAVVKTFKNKRNVVAYQLINIREMKEYVHRNRFNFEKFIPGKKVKKQSQSKFAKKIIDIGILTDNQFDFEFEPDTIDRIENEYILS